MIFNWHIFFVFYGMIDPIITKHAVQWLVSRQTYAIPRQRLLVWKGSAWLLIYEDSETCVYHNIRDRRICIGFRGTKTQKDLYDDFLISTNQIFPRAIEAIELTRRMKVEYPCSTILLTGHSLGGAIAREVGNVYLVSTVTFNAASPPSFPVLIINPFEVDYHIVFDFISAWQQGPNVIRIDKGYWPMTWWNPYAWGWHIFDGVKNSHRLTNFSDEKPGKIIPAFQENQYMRKWFASLPFTLRVPVLTMLFAAGNYSTTLPEIK